MSREFTAANSDGINIGRIASTESTQNFSASFWVYRPTSTTVMIASKGDSFSNELAFYWHTDGTFFLQIRVGSHGWNLYKALDIPYAQWTHYFIVYDGTQATPADRYALYIDKVFVSPVGTVGTLHGTTPSFTTDWSVGFRDANNSYGSGTFSQIKFWSNSLSINDAKSDYTGITPSRNTLVSWHPFGYASPEPEYSGQGENGTVTGTPSVEDGPPITMSFGADEQIIYTIVEGAAGSPFYAYMQQ